MASVTVTLVASHGGQQPLDEAWHDPTVRYITLRCGRRFGKTTWSDMRASEVALKGGNVGWFTPNSDYADPVWRGWVERFASLTKRRDEQARTLWLHTGGVLEMWTLHNTEDPGRSRKYDLAVVDEAGLVDNLDIVWGTAIAPTLWDRKGRGLLVGTPKGRRTPFNVLHERAADGSAGREWKAFQFGTVDNPHIPREEVDKFRAECERNGTQWMYEQEALGIPADDGSNPIGLEAITRATSKPSTEAVAAVGIDLAQSVDYTVIYALDAYGRWTHVERWQSPWTLTKRRIADWLRRHACEDGKTLSIPVCVDASGVGSPVVGDLHAMGLDVQGVVFTASTRRNMLERLIVDVQGKRVTLPPKTDPARNFVVQELESLGTETLPSGAIRYGVPDGMHDDGMMALALACKAFRGSSQPEWVASKPARELDNRHRPVRDRQAAREEAMRGPYAASVRYEDYVSGHAGKWDTVDY